MLPRQVRKVIGIWNGIMKYKVLKDYPTADGVLYKGEMVKEWNSVSDKTKIRVKDNMGRIWSIPKILIQKV